MKIETNTDPKTCGISVAQLTENLTHTSLIASKPTSMTDHIKELEEEKAALTNKLQEINHQAFAIKVKQKGLNDRIKLVEKEIKELTQSA